MPTPTIPDRYAFMSDPRAAGPMGAYYRNMAGAIDARLAALDPTHGAAFALRSPESYASWGAHPSGSIYDNGWMANQQVQTQAIQQAAANPIASLPPEQQQIYNTIMGSVGRPADAQAGAVNIANWIAQGRPQAAGPPVVNPNAVAQPPPSSNLSLYRSNTTPNAAPYWQHATQIATAQPQQTVSQTATATPTVAPPQTPAPQMPTQSALPPGMQGPQLAGPTTNVGAYGYNPPQMQQSTLPGQTDQPPQEPSAYSLADIYGLKQDNPLINATTWT